MHFDREFLIIGEGQVNWNGRLFTFNESEEKVFNILLDDFLHGTPAVRWTKIQRLTKNDFSVIRLKRVFLHGKKVNNAWGTLIVKGPNRGFYQLAIDPATEITDRDGSQLLSEACRRTRSPALNGTPESASFRA